MISAAIYCRKSTDEADDAKSVVRQLERARAYADRQGWTVLESCVFVDDGVSGAEWKHRPAFQRLLGRLKATPPFSDERLDLAPPVTRRHAGRRDYYGWSHRAMTAQSMVPATSATIHGSIWDFQ